jgi:hypothetical protein
VASTLDRYAADNTDAVVEGDADYLPESYGPPVAAGPEIESLDAQAGPQPAPV